HPDLHSFPTRRSSDLGADLAVVTGDLITGAGDSIADCIDQIRHLYAPLGIWGCNGNHEIYAHAEDQAYYLYAQAGMKLLRHSNEIGRAHVELQSPCNL